MKMPDKMNYILCISHFCHNKLFIVHAMCGFGRNGQNVAEVYLSQSKK